MSGVLCCVSLCISRKMAGNKIRELGYYLHQETENMIRTSGGGGSGSGSEGGSEGGSKSDVK